MSKTELKFFIMTAFLALLLLVTPVCIIAATMSSTHYMISADSINTGGDSYSTSTNYDLGDTVGEVGTGYSTSTNYQVSAGYWASSQVWISLSSGGNLNLGSISGIGGATATGSLAYIATTNNADGYELEVSATSSPAMTSASSNIPDYSPSGSNPDYNFTLSSSADARFGFSPAGTDVVARYKNNGSSCNTGSSSTLGTCWDGFSTSNKVISSTSTPNNPNGATTTVEFEVKLGSARLQDPTNPYQATIVVTALTL